MVVTIANLRPIDNNGKTPWNFKGWRHCGRNNNYREIWVKGRGYVREHRLVMEEYLGRKLESAEEIHHIDGDGLNNDLSNLVIMSKSDHLRLEHRNGKYTASLNKIHGTSKVST